LRGRYTDICCLHILQLRICVTLQIVRSAEHVSSVTLKIIVN